MLVWQLRSAFDSLEQLPLIHHQHLLDLLNNQLLDTKTIRAGSNPATQLFICLLHLFCAARLDLEWNVAVVDIPRNAQIFFAAVNVEVADIRTDPTNTSYHISPDRLQASLPSNWSWEFFFSLDLSPNLCRYLSERFLRICLTFPSAFVRRAFWSRVVKLSGGIEPIWQLWLSLSCE